MSLILSMLWMILGAVSIIVAYGILVVAVFEEWRIGIPLSMIAAAGALVATRMGKAELERWKEGNHPGDPS